MNRNLNCRQKFGATEIVLLATTFATAFLVIFFFISPPAWPFMPPEGGGDKGKDVIWHHMPPWEIWPNPEMMQDLGLTDEQVKKLTDVIFICREKHMELKSQIDILHIKRGSVCEC